MMGDRTNEVAIHLVSTVFSRLYQWLECATDDGVFAGSNPTEAAWKLWQFRLPHFTSLFRKIH